MVIDAFWYTEISKYMVYLITRWIITIIDNKKKTTSGLSWYYVATSHRHWSLSTVIYVWSSYLWLFRSLSPGTFPSGSPATAGFARRPCGPFCRSTIWRRRNSGTDQWDPPSLAGAANCASLMPVRLLQTSEKVTCFCTIKAVQRAESLNHRLLNKGINDKPILCFHVRAVPSTLLWVGAVTPLQPLKLAVWFSLPRQRPAALPGTVPLLCPIRTNCLQIRHWAGKEVELGLTQWRGSINVNSFSTEKTPFRGKKKVTKTGNKVFNIKLKSLKLKSEIEIQMSFSNGAGAFEWLLKPVQLPSLLIQ